MQIAFSSFWLQKAGNQTEEYEDAFAPLKYHEGEYPEFLCAVADGATETSFSGLWASILVEAFVNKNISYINQEIAEIAHSLSSNWYTQIAEITKEKPLSWYAEEKLRNGAYASLTGLHLHEGGRWTALCVGDSCLFQLRPPRSVLSFPYSKPSQFNNHPLLISTNRTSNSQVKPIVAEGKWKEGDCFLLMTDALAHYFMSDYKRAKPQFIPSLLSQDRFTTIVEAARQARVCRNDDVTLLKVCIKPGVSNGDVA